ncbi:MAG: hypothetical protein AAF907_05480, partial [Planctomycetota bacterium]
MGDPAERCGALLENGGEGRKPDFAVPDASPPNRSSAGDPVPVSSPVIQSPVRTTAGRRHLVRKDAMYKLLLCWRYLCTR